MEGLLVLILAIVAVVVVVGGVWLYRKHQYIKAIRQRGWTWVESPELRITTGLNSAPFGIGFSRRVDDQVIGRGPDGEPFQAFRYNTDSFSSSGYVVTMKLPRSLPTVSAFHPDRPCSGVSGTLVASDPLHVVARRPDFGGEFASVLLRALPALLNSQQQPMSADVGVDHDQLVMLHVPREPADLALAVAWLERLHRSLMSSHAAAFEGAPPPSHLSFQDRDHWVYRPAEDSMLNHVNHTGGGFGHEATDIITSENHGLPFIRLTHTWKTQHTSTDAKGNTTTHTQSHSEDIT